MVEVTVTKEEMIERLKSDPEAREKFLTNTHKLLSDMGVQKEPSEIQEKLEAQLNSPHYGRPLISG
jgi:hypothetical protein